jgi:serine protease AprX
MERTIGSRRQVSWGLAAAVAVALGSAGMQGSSAAAAAPVPVPVIVQFDAGRMAAVEHAISAAGGTVTRPLQLISAVSAALPAASLTALRAVPGVLAVTPDSSVQLEGSTWQSDSTQTTMPAVRESSGINTAYRYYPDMLGRQLTGKGIGVALIDSGVNPVTGLNDSARIVNGPDLSFESQAPNLRYYDTFGHGTHMAGIIAGHDPDLLTGKYDDAKKFAGAAPDSTLISVKVAAADGATDVSQVIAGIDWVVQHRNDPGMNIRVLNLSFGTDSHQDP